MVEAQPESGLIGPAEAQLLQDLRAGVQHLSLHQSAGGANHIQVALIEFSKASFGGPVGAVDGRDVVAFEVAGQLIAVLGDDTGERHGQIVAQTGVGDVIFGWGLGERPLQLCAALGDAEYQLIALFAVFAQQRVQPFHHRRVERFKAVTLIDAFDYADDILAAQHVQGQKVACAADRLGLKSGHWSFSYNVALTKWSGALSAASYTKRRGDRKNGEEGKAFVTASEH